MMASMRDGSGDEYFILFNSRGVIMKGFAHESSMSPWATESEKVWPGVLDEVPSEFQEFLTEPAFSMGDTTFCIWQRKVDRSWQVGQIDYPEEEDPDGSEDLLFILDGAPTTYREFAEQYYERPVDLSAVIHVYEQKPLTTEILEVLNAEVSREDLNSDLEQIAYPKGAI